MQYYYYFIKRNIIPSYTVVGLNAKPPIMDYRSTKPVGNAIGNLMINGKTDYLGHDIPTKG